MNGTIIAEVGSVHDGSFGNACKLVTAAAAAGADAVKFQTHIAAAETLRDAPAPSYFKGEPRFAYFERTAFDADQWRELAAHCRSTGVGFLSSPFSLEAVELLEAVGIEAYKIPSGEVSNLPLLERVAATGKPVLLSSGMSDWGELDRAVATLREHGCGELTVFQCTSAYPCPPERAGVNVLAELRSRYDCVLGWSDHCEGFGPAAAMAAHGASVIEKHITFSRAMYGSDAANAMELDDFAVYCRTLREVWAACANPVDKNDLGPYREMKQVFEKSVVLADAIAAGTVLNRCHLAFKKPGSGIPAADYRTLLGRIVRHDLPADHLLGIADLHPAAPPSDMEQQ